jgi:hypothetical protein
MNRSILIVICDFLLISLLAFSTVDPEAIVGDMSNRQVKMEMSVSNPDNREDLASVMKLALDDERQARDLLLGELERTRQTISQQQTVLTERERQAAERERQMQAAQQNLQSKEQQARQLAQAKQVLELQVAGAQTNLQNLQRQLSAADTQSRLSTELASVTREELRREQERNASLQKQLSHLELSNQLVQAEKQQLTAHLQVAQAEKRAVAEQATRMQEEVKVVREEKERLTQHADKLADGVKTLATHSGELAREIRENRPLAPNALFVEFATNRVHARFQAYRPGLLGMDHSRKKETETILTSDGTNYYALCHVEDTAVSFADPGAEWQTLSGSLSRNAAGFPARSLSFALLDPRVVFIPLTPAQARELGCKVYQIASDPFRFQEALLVGAAEGYYGECKFEIDLANPQYVKMDRSLMRGLFGKFNPSRGDLVLSKTGELLGLMVNGTYCLRIYNFASVATLQFGQDVRAQRPGEVLARMHSLIFSLPFKLQ